MILSRPLISKANNRYLLADANAQAIYFAVARQTKIKQTHLGIIRCRRISKWQIQTCKESHPTFKLKSKRIYSEFLNYYVGTQKLHTLSLGYGYMLNTGIFNLFQDFHVSRGPLDDPITIPISRYALVEHRSQTRVFQEK